MKIPVFHSSIRSLPVKAKPEVDTDLLYAIHPELLHDAYIYAHIHVPRTSEEILIRIWRTTSLVDKSSELKAGLVHAENITIAPLWTIVPRHFTYTFLLIFNALPTTCRVFDLLEEINQPGGFYIPNIIRNESDVYHVDLAL
jgi:hypothetical protein